MKAANVLIGAAGANLFPTLASTRDLELKNESGSAGTATFSISGYQTNPSTALPVTLNPGQGLTVYLTPGIGQPGCGTLQATAASTAIVSARRVPL